MSSDPELTRSAGAIRLSIGRTIQGRLAIVFAALLLPPTVLSLWIAWDSFQDHRERAGDQVRQFAIMTATYEGKFFENAGAALRRLSTEPALRDPELGGCEELLTETIERNPAFTQLALYDIEGEPVCGTGETMDSVAEYDWHAEAQTADNLAISNYTLSSKRGFPAIVAARAVIGSDGTLSGVLAATIPLSWFADLTDDIGLPSGSLFFLVSGNGEVLAGRFADRDRRPRSAAQVTVGSGAGAAGGSGPALPRAFEVQAPAADREELALIVGEPFFEGLGERSLLNFETDGEDGITRVFSAITLPHGRVTALFGMPAGNILGWLEQDIMNQMLAIAAMWFSGLIAAWFGARYLVTRWIGKLRGLANAYGQGNYAERSNLINAPDELSELGATLALMAQRIQDREAALHATVAQKDILLREIHHRVKNNLQIVSSLLNIRGDRVTSQAGLAAMDEVKSQVRALALVHRHLYETGEVLEIDLQAFMTELCESTLAALAEPDCQVTLRLEIPSVMIATDRAIPVALLTVEAITNALKHAFPEGRAGTITVRFEPDGAGAGRLLIADDGVGIAPGAWPPRGLGLGGQGGIGLRLIDAFARQVEGRLEITPGPGGTGTLVSVTLAPLAHEAAAE